MPSTRMCKLPYFAYGSNLNIKQMKRRCKDSECLNPAILKGYELEFRANKNGFGVANILKTKSSLPFIKGALYNVSLDDLIALDAYEGYPYLYKRKKIIVESIKKIKGKLVKSEIEAFCYVMQPDYIKQMPSANYIETIKQGYEDWEFSLTDLSYAIGKMMEGIYGLPRCV